jgi:signal transduction histidine kinase
MPYLNSPKPLWLGIALVIAACLALVGLNIYQDARIAPEIAQDRALVTHTFDVIATAQALDQALQDAERGERGFLITGAAEYLDPYRRGTQAVPALLSKLRQLTAGNPEQQSRLPILEDQIHFRLDQLRHTIEVRQREGFEAARGIVQSNLGFDSMRSATALIGASIEAENVLLTQRVARVAEDDRNVRVIAKAGLALTLVIMALGVVLILITFRERARQQQVLEQTTAVLAQAQKMETLGQLSGGIAHDFNNMLAVIKSGIGLLRRRLQTTDSDVKRFIDGIESGADRAAALTHRLLAFARRQPLAPEPIDPNYLITGMTDLLQRILDGDAGIETVLAAGLWRVCADASQLENVILNLAVNARDAMLEGGKLTIETGNVFLDEAYAAVHPQVTPGQYVMIAVSDTGTGMTPEILAKAFEPFFTTKAVGQGTGLGLSQVYGFIKQSSGHVQIYSEPGEGTTVKLYLPRLAGTETTEVQKKTQPVKMSGGTNKRAILLVEDK